MYVGLLTARFDKTKPFEEIAEWASRAGYTALEVTSGPDGHIKPAEVLADGGAAVKEILDRTGLKISSLTLYRGVKPGTKDAEKYVEDFKEVLKAAEALDVDVVCTLAGFPAEGKDKMTTIKEDLPGLFGPLGEEAAKRGVKIAFENCWAFNLQNLDHFAAAMEVLPESIGLNYDPSHLYWQRLDYLAAVDEFGSRIFHTHAKDTTEDEAALKRVGVLEHGWWRYSIPGTGGIDWTAYTDRLKSVGYDGVLSVEHEDKQFGPEEGFEKAIEHLSRFV